MTPFEKKLAKLEADLKIEQHKNAVLTFFVFKYLDDIYKKSNIEDKLLNLGLHNRPELASLAKGASAETIDNLARELNDLANLYKRINK